MVSRPKLEILKKEYGITDKKLEKLGVIMPIPKTISTRLNLDEYNRLNKLSYTFGKTKSYFLRHCVEKIINNDPDMNRIISAGNKLNEKLKLQKKKVVTFKLSIEKYKKLLRVSRSECIPVSRLLRYYLLIELNIININKE